MPNLISCGNSHLYFSRENSHETMNQAHNSKMHKALNTAGFHLSSCKYIWQQIMIPTNTYKATYSYDFPNYYKLSTAEIIFYCRINNVLDGGVLWNIILCKFFKNQKNPVFRKSSCPSSFG